MLMPQETYHKLMEMRATLPCTPAKKKVVEEKKKEKLILKTIMIENGRAYCTKCAYFHTKKPFYLKIKRETICCMCNETI